MKKNLLIMIFLSMATLASGQNRTVTGRITDASDGSGLPGVNVLLKGTTTGTVTDTNGTYTIEVPNNGVVLVFSFIGMLTQEIEIGTQSQVDVRMDVDATTLSEVLVTAYGTTKKTSFTGSAVQLNSEALEGRAITNVTAALEGVSGVMYSPSNGQPGSSSEIRIRGVGSINGSSDPLYVVDGMPFSGSLSSINPQDIESYSVLKDAASTSLYGSKAANGVIMITTKKGKSGQSKFNVNLSYGISERGIPEYERINAHQYYPLMWESMRNSNAIPGVDLPADVDAANLAATNTIFSALKTNPFNVPNDQIVLTDGKLNPSAKLLYADDLNWQKPLEGTGSRKSIDLSYQGGTEKSSQFFSLSALDETGWAINSDFQRVSGRVSMDVKPKNWLKTGFNLAATTSVSNLSNDAGSTNSVNPFNGTRYVAPIYPVFEHDPTTGDYILDSNGDKIYDLGANRVGSQVGRHVIYENLLATDRDKIFSAQGKAFVEVNFLKDFKFTLNASLDSRYLLNEDFDSNIVGDGAPLGRASRASSTRTNASYNQLLNYNKSFGDHTIGVLLGHESMNYTVTSFTGSRNDMIAEGNTELGNFTTITGLDSWTRDLKTEGYFGRAEYNYIDKYFLSASYRRDGSSRFSKDARWGDFWSMGAAWRLDQESFIQSIPAISALKLRASFGQVGNDGAFSTAIDYYASQALFGLGWNNDTEAGVTLNQLANPDLKWETNEQSDIAVEFSVLDYRLSGTIEYYNRKSADLLFNVPLPVSSGVGSITRNIGDMVNSGVEITLSGDILRTQDFTWTLDFQTSTIKNEIKKLPNDSIINGSKQYVKGGSIYSYWLKQWYGVDPEDGAGLYVADATVNASDVDARTINGTLLTTNQNKAQYAFVGTALPDFFGSITNSLTYKSFKLSFMFNYQIGGKTYDTNYANLMSSGDYGVAKHTDILNRWQKPGDVTNVPRMDVGESPNFDAGSSRWLVNSSFIALRQITFSYDLPFILISKAGLGNARIYANAENLFFNAERKGMNVNQNLNGTTGNAFTPARIVSLGMNVTF